ncbi:MAG: Gfo/Idh/MocA family oxidoreductase [Armatimonadetes bacterium]|nr:Gfo/Idh/MocA family oxidoreductase [Armatimonadota bacterium]
MARLGVGVIGLGHNGLAWCEAYQSCPYTDLRAVCDLDPERLRAASERFSVDGYGGYEILDRADAEIISVHTPDHLHAEPFILALRAGKHVIVEKPMAASLEDLSRMVEAARAASTKSMVAQVLRFHPLFSFVRKMIDNGQLGEIFYLEADYIHDLRYQKYMEKWKVTIEIPILSGGVHPLDLLRWFAGDIVEVYGMANHIAYKEMHEPTTEAALFKFAGGAVGKVAALYGTVSPMVEWYNLCVHGTTGTVRGNRLCLDGNEAWMEIPVPPQQGHPFEAEACHFALCILRDEQPLIDAVEGAKSAQACLLAHQSALEGRPLPVPPL